MDSKILIILGLCFCVLFLQAQELKLSVSANPALPVKNYLPQGADFESENGLKRFGSIHGKHPAETISLVNRGYNSKTSLQISGGFGEGQFCIGIKPDKNFDLTKKYIVSVMIKPCLKYGNGTSWGGLGVGIEGAKDKTRDARFIGNPEKEEVNRWKKVVSSPFAVGSKKEMFLWLNNYFGSGGGLLDDITFGEAFTQLTFQAESGRGIRQAVILNDNGERVYDSGILLNSPKSFTKTLQMQTPYIYTVRVLDIDGCIKSVTYPQENNNEK